MECSTLWEVSRNNPWMATFARVLLVFHGRAVERGWKGNSRVKLCQQKNTRTMTVTVHINHSMTTF